MTEAMRQAHERGAVSGEAVLPGILEEVERLAGREAAINLALHHGGREVYFPAEKSIDSGRDHLLFHTLGAAVVPKLCRRFGGNAIYVPRARRACAIHLARQGASPTEIACRLATSIYTARRYIRGS